MERNWHGATLSSGGHTLGRSNRPHTMAAIDPKGYGRMRGTAADRSVHHPWVLLSGGTRDRNAATELKGCKAEGQTRRYPYGKAEKEPAALSIPHHWTPLAGGTRDSEAVMGTQTQDSNKLLIGV